MLSERIKALLSTSFEMVTRRNDPGLRIALRISGRMALNYRGWLIVSFLANTLSAMLEGLTLGGLYFGLTALTEGVDSILGKIPDWSPEIIGVVLSNVDSGEIFLFFIGVAIVAQLLKAGSDYLSGIAGVTLSIRMKNYMQEETVKRIMTMDYSSIMKFPPGRLVTYVNESEKLGAVVDEAVQMFRVGIMLGTYLAIVLSLSLIMAMVTLFVMAFFWYVVNQVLKRIRPMIDSVVDNEIETSRWTVEYLNFPRILRIFGNEEYASDRIRQSRNLWLTMLMRAERLRVFIEPMLESVTIIAAGTILVAGYFLAGESATSFVPKLFVFVGAFLRMRPLIKYFNDFRLRVVHLVAYLKQIGGFFYESDQMKSEVGLLPANRLTRGISFDNVCYRYLGTSNNVIKNISLDIPVGKTTAIVGRTGAGKSTLADLLIGLIVPNSGNIFVDGVCLTDIDKTDWRRRLGVVDQEVILTNSTVFDNIQFGNAGVSEEDVVEAAKLSNAADFIEHLEDGFKTRVGDRGFRLSGGQQQRIALARALIRKPDILILDEATSSLDNLSEELIQTALSNLKGALTVVVIAHRLTTIQHAENIIVLEGGSVVEQGTWEELVESRGLFFRMSERA